MLIEVKYEIGRDSQKMTKHTVEDVRPSSIILLHVMSESREPSMQAVIGAISGLREKDYALKPYPSLYNQQSPKEGCPMFKVYLKPIMIGDSASSLGLSNDCLNALNVLKLQEDYYLKVGFKPPWISYFAFAGSEAVGVCSFKGAPIEGKVEIAYFTFSKNEGKGYGNQMCDGLIRIVQQTDPHLMVTARSLPMYSASTSILLRNGFELAGVVLDPEDGEVWEWSLTGRGKPIEDF